VVVISIITQFDWGTSGTQPSWVYVLINAVALLIIACHCALGLAAAISIMVSNGHVATQGVLYLDVATIEILRNVIVLIVDKTGTLTEGRPAFEQAIPAGDTEADEVLRLAASLDQGSEHPLADAIVNAARERGLNLSAVNDFESGSGIGVRGHVDGKRLA